MDNKNIWFTQKELDTCFEARRKIYEQKVKEAIQTFQKSLNKTLTELEIEFKERENRFRGITNDYGLDDGELAREDVKRISDFGIPKEILIIESKIGALNELKKELGIENG